MNTCENCKYFKVNLMRRHCTKHGYTFKLIQGPMESLGILEERQRICDDHVRKDDKRTSLERANFRVVRPLKK